MWAVALRRAGAQIVGRAARARALLADKPATYVFSDLTVVAQAAIEKDIDALVRCLYRVA